MRFPLLVISFLLAFISNAQTVQDDFEGSGTITTWYGDNCAMDTSFANPYQESINTSATVLRYHDTGGQYANVQFDITGNYDLTTKNTFALKIYVPSSGLTGSQNNQISLKLQDASLAQPWTTQSEIIKTIQLNEWQEVTFNFDEDTYINLDGSSPPPNQRTDFSRVVIQVNGENNNDHVLAYIDDLDYYETVSTDPVFDNLVWSDEFDGSGAIDATKWHHQTIIPNGVSWYNGEIQHYTNRVDNSNVSGGNLNLIAKKEVFTDQGQTKQYTSARLNSKFAFTYGKVEIRAKLPTGVGTWPALWMLGKNITETGGYWQTQGFGTTGWPACGEIDIMEHWGDNQNFVQSAMHTPSSSGNTDNKGGQIVSTALSDFHVYTLVWTSERMVFSVDDVIHYIYNPEVKDANTWPFDAEQYLLFNVAILPNITAGFTESAMEVDYVRVYQESALSTDELETNQDVLLYPNPVKDTLRVDLKNTNIEIADVQILDINGRLVSKKDYDTITEGLVYNVSMLKQGLYFLRLKFVDGTSLSRKLIKE